MVAGNSQSADHIVFSSLRPILDEFVPAASGQPTPDFWKAIYKPEEALRDNTNDRLDHGFLSLFG